ncbi:MAG: DegT/DnrJ/EryC1/StrS aminotransferase family protein [Pseudomonadota bacterium]
MIPHSRPTLDEEDRQAVLNVLQVGRLVQGEQVAGFEADLSAMIGTSHAAAVSSGTAALHLALMALGAENGDEVICPSYVCSALLHAIRCVKATPVIADIERDTFNIDVQDVKERITSKTKAIIVPHLFGLPADMAGILSLGIPVIEDCAQAPGSRFRDCFTGSFGVISIFSFYATKVIAAGEGGMALSNDPSLIEKIRDLRDYDEREEDALHYNYKMTDMQAALGRSQLRKIDGFIKRRREIARHYDLILNEAGIPIPVTPPEMEHIYYRYVVLLDQAEAFIEIMNQSGVACRRPVFKPLHRYLGLSGYFMTDDVWKKAVSIPIYPSLTEHELVDITDCIRKNGLSGGRCGY